MVKDVNALTFVDQERDCQGVLTCMVLNDVVSWVKGNHHLLKLETKLSG